MMTQTEIIDRYFKAAQTEENLRRVVKDVLGTDLLDRALTGDGVADADKAEVLTLTKTLLDKVLPVTIQRYRQFYLDMTEEESNVLVALYENPVYRKYAERAVIIREELGQILNEEVDREVKAMRGRAQ
jgi:hypothetical protein